MVLRLPARTGSSGSRRLRRSPRPSCPDTPNWAPIAAGKPKPIVPAPPLLSQWRFERVRTELRGPHLVLSDVGGDDRIALVIASSRSNTCCARSPPCFGYLSGYVLRQVSHWASHSSVSAISTRGSSSSSTSRASPSIEDDRAGSILLNSAMSMSMWILTASVQNSSKLARDAIVPASADRHDQVAVRDGLVRVGGAVHAEHAEVQGVGLVGRRPCPSRVFTTGARSSLGKCVHRLACTRDHRAVADVEQRPPGGS